MSAKTVVNSDDIYENRNLRKQIGCMNGLFQLFDRHHFLTSSSKHKNLLLGAQHQLESHNATKAVTDTEVELQKEKPRTSKELSSSCSSLDHNRTNISESPFQITAKKAHGPSLSKGPKSPHIRDVVKDSMYREARAVSIKSFTNDEQKVTVIKHIDSPRPLHKSRFEKPKATRYEESNRVFARDERLILHRLSYDGRESRDTLKTKHKELPRLSLDSKASSVKCSGLDSRLSLLGQESGSHSRTSSVVAKLMGLGDFPNTITTDENNITKPTSSSGPRDGFLSNSSTTTKESKEKQTSFSKPTVSLRLPMEPAPWKQKDYSRDSPKMAAESMRSPNLPSSSVYAEMEKRITQLEFKSSGKDLRALKQILEAMQKTREKMGNQGREPAELPKQKQLCSSNRITKSAKVIEKVKILSSSKVPTVEKTHIRNLQTQGTKCHNRENKAFRETAKDFIRPRNNYVKEPSRQFSPVEKKITWTNLELEQTLRAPQRMRVENYATSRRDFEMESPKSQQNALSSSGRSQKHPTKKVRENCSLSKKMKVNKAMDFQLSDDEQLSEVRYSSHQDTASVKSESNNSVASHLETEVISLASSTNPNFREQQNSPSTSKEHMLVIELAEQPSPVSVLDTAFYTEDSPSPVKMISTAFQDESPRPDDEAEWPLETLNHFSDCTQSNPAYKYNQDSQDMLPLIHASRLLKTELSQTAVNQNESVNLSIIPDQRYINRILAASGLFKDACIMPTANQLNPDIFHVLEEMEEENGKLTEKNNRKEFNQKMQRRIVFDMVSEFMVRKITSDGLFTQGRKRMSPHGLLKELYLEMDHLCGMPYGNLDDEDDGWIRLLTADMKYRSDDWIDYSGEVPAMVLEIERLIFKDLINEVVTGQVEGLHTLPNKYCRQLFTK